MPDFYGDESLSARIYDADHPGGEGPIEGDVAFYVGLAREPAGAVLELGAGTGRVALPLAEAGFDVVGLERSRSMLEVLRARVREASEGAQRRLSIVKGDMASFDLGREFALVIIAFRSFQLLRSLDDQRSCLVCVRRHLAAGGRLAVHLFDPRLDTVTPGTFGWTGPRRSEARPVAASAGARIDRTLVYRTNDTLNQQFEEVWRFREYNADGTVAREEEEVMRMRWIYRNEMRYLLELCGFAVEAEYSDFFGSPPAYGKEQVWVARRMEA